jgi:hypothetical protein
MLMVGDGPERSSAEWLAHKYGLDRKVQFLGNGMNTTVPADEAKDYTKVQDMFNYLIEAFLGMGLVVGIAGHSDLKQVGRMGLKALETAELKLENLELPAESRLGGDALTVVGVEKQNGTFFGQSMDNTVYIPYTLYLKKFGSRQSISVRVKAPSSGALQSTQDEVRVIMRAPRPRRGPAQGTLATPRSPL